MERRRNIWDRGNMIYDGINQYMYGPDGIETAWADEFQYYVKDIKGSVIYTANLVGNNINEYGYDSFGNKKEERKEYDDPFGYCGEYYDEETGSVSLRNRCYNPNTVRFITDLWIRLVWC